MDDARSSISAGDKRPDASPSGPIEAGEGRLRPADSAARAFGLIADSALTQIAANAEVLRQARRLEAVHQLRVGLRRLRGAIALFAPMLEGEGCERVKAELKWMTRELNDARNLDVLIAETFRPAARRHRDWIGMAALGKTLLAAQTKAYDRAQIAARSARFGVLMLETTDWVEAGDWRASADPERIALNQRPIGKLAPALLREGLKAVLKKGRKLETLDPRARHKLRLQVKQLRYATGFFADLYADDEAKAHKRFDRATRALQTALGELTDIATAAEVCAEVVGAGRSETLPIGPAQAQAAFAAGMVAARRAAGEAEAKAAAMKAYRAFERTASFW
jgi:CHAD domain-containing protein